MRKHAVVVNNGAALTTAMELQAVRRVRPNNVSLVFGILCCSGGFAAAVTTPLDVAKTRIMLAKVRVKEAHRHAAWLG